MFFYEMLFIVAMSHKSVVQLNSGNCCSFPELLTMHIQEVAVILPPRWRFNYSPAQWLLFQIHEVSLSIRMWQAQTEFTKRTADGHWWQPAGGSKTKLWVWLLTCADHDPYRATPNQWTPATHESPEWGTVEWPTRYRFLRHVRWVYGGDIEGWAQL